MMERNTGGTHFGPRGSFLGKSKPFFASPFVHLFLQLDHDFLRPPNMLKSDRLKGICPVPSWPLFWTMNEAENCSRILNFGNPGAELSERRLPRDRFSISPSLKGMGIKTSNRGVVDGMLHQRH